MLEKTDCGIMALHCIKKILPTYVDHKQWWHPLDMQEALSTLYIILLGCLGQPDEIGFWVSYQYGSAYWSLCIINLFLYLGTTAINGKKNYLFYRSIIGFPHKDQRMILIEISTINNKIHNNSLMQDCCWINYAPDNWSYLYCVIFSF